MITAKEARALAGVDDIQEEVDLVLVAIEKAAKEKKRRIDLHSDFWTNGGYNQTKDWQEACLRLKNLGFSVDFFYEERQFVNMFTKVTW